MFYFILILFVTFIKSEIVKAESSQENLTAATSQVRQSNGPKSQLVFNEIVDHYYHKTGKDLEKESFRLYKLGNNAEVAAQIFGGLTPIFTGLSVSIKSPSGRTICIISACISSTLALSSNNFAKFSYNESKQRLEDLNNLLKAQGYEPLPIMHASLNTDNVIS